MGKVAPWTRLQTIFKPSYKMNVFKSNIVSKLNCGDCAELYIIQTTED